MWPFNWLFRRGVPTATSPRSYGPAVVCPPSSQSCPACGNHWSYRYGQGTFITCGGCPRWFSIDKHGRPVECGGAAELRERTVVSKRQTPSQIALEVLQDLGDVIHAHDAGEVHDGGYYVYLVYNGPNVLQVGQGRRSRMKKCMRGGLAGKHNKAFICAVGELVFGQPNKYAYVRMSSPDAVQSAEKRLHCALGVTTNQHSATLIEGIQLQSIPEIHAALWRCKGHE